jgi:hypothetical protein
MVTHFYHYKMTECKIESVDKAPVDCFCMIRYVPRQDLKDGETWGHVDVWHYPKGIHMWEYIEPEELDYFEPANVASRLCRRLGICLERPARYAIACEDVPVIMYITE